jgi:hypothetical protein
MVDEPLVATAKGRPSDLIDLETNKYVGKTCIALIPYDNIIIINPLDKSIAFCTK